MSIITSRPRSELLISGKSYHIDCDFRLWIKFSVLLASSDKGINDFLEIIKAVFSELPNTFEETVSAMVGFLSDTDKDKAAEKSPKKENRKPSYDFEYDAEMIYAAFLEQYGIDLSECEMHWKKFKALFDNLSEKTQFMRVVQYRNMDLSKIKDKEQKAFYKRMKRIYVLPDRRSEEQKDADFDEAFGNMFM